MLSNHYTQIADAAQAILDRELPAPSVRPFCDYCRSKECNCEGNDISVRSTVDVVFSLNTYTDSTTSRVHHEASEAQLCDRWDETLQCSCCGDGDDIVIPDDFWDQLSFEL